MNSGLYQINIGDYFYFGQTKDLKRRKRVHLNNLKKGNHHNEFMQNVYNKYREFDFQEVLHCSVDELNDQEQRLLDAFWGTEGCMNICPIANSSKGRKLSDEHKRKLSEAKKGKKNPMYGKTGEKSTSYDHTLFTFVHAEHGEVTCTRYELWTKHNLTQGHLSKVVSGKRNHTGGWRLKEPV